MLQLLNNYFANTNDPCLIIIIIDKRKCDKKRLMGGGGCNGILFIMSLPSMLDYISDYL